MQALVGLSINLLILRSGGASYLGVFNQIYAVFVIAGQGAVLGLHDSAQRHVAEGLARNENPEPIAFGAVVASCGAGLAGGSILYLLSDLIGALVSSAEVGQGIRFLAPGLICFTINKVLMGVLNGRRRMRSFAVGQALRATTVLGCCWMVLREGRPASEFGYAFTVAEVVLLAILLLFIRPLGIGARDGARDWIRKHLAFGTRALPHGFLSEAFIRIDVLMLGVFLSDELVGVYSFAAFFVEGAYQVAIVVRTVNNPILVSLLLKGQGDFVSFARRTALLSLVATAGLSVAIGVIYPFLGAWMPLQVIEDSHQVLLILLTGLTVFSVCVPFDYLLLQSGRPGSQSIYMGVNTAVNVVLNAVLIPVWGLYGAAVATGLAFAWSGILLNVLADRMLSLRGGLFWVRA